MVIFSGKPVSASAPNRTSEAVRTRSSRILSTLLAPCLAFAVMANAPAASEAQVRATPQFTAASAPQILCPTQVVGNRRIPRESVLARLFSRPGDQYDPAMVERDFNSLWNTGYFEDVRIERVDDPNCVQMIVYVREKPTIREINYKGLNAVSVSDVLERFKKAKVGLSVESQYDPTRVKRAEVVLKELLGEHGHQFAIIRTEIKTIPPAAVALTFNVKEGPTVKVGKIQFTGNDHVPARDLRASMRNLKPIGVPHSIFLEDILPRTYDASKLDEDAERVRQAYRDRGYAKATYGEPETNVRNAGGINPLTLRPSTGKRVDILIPIEEGERYRLGGITFTGNKTLNNAKALRSQFAIKDGDWFNATAFGKGLQALQKAYGSYGFINFVGTPTPRFDEAKHLVYLDIDIDEGKQFYISRIEFSGNTLTRDRVIRRELMVEEGQKYSSQLVEYSLQRLNQLSYFENLKVDEDVETRQNADAGTVDLLIKLKEKGKNSIGLNGGLSGQSGSFIGLNYETNNFLGFGETLSVNANIGDMSRNLSFGFTEPYLRNKPVSLGVQVFTTKLDYNPAKSYAIANGQSANLTNQQNSLLTNYNQSSTGFTISTSSALRRFLRLSGVSRLGLSYSLSRSGVTAFNDNTRNVFSTLAFRSGVAGQNSLDGIVSSIISPSFSFSTLDRGVGPHSGRDFNMVIQFAGLGGNTKYVAPTISFRQFYPMKGLRINKEGHNVLAMRAQYSSVYGYGGQVAPPFARIYGGGENDVRGFDIRSSSPYTFVPVRQLYNLTNPDGSLVPRDPTNPSLGNVQIPLPLFNLSSVGADTSFTGNVEYRIPIMNQVTFALFTDFGMAFDTSNAQLRQSVLGLSQLNAPLYGCPQVVNGNCFGGKQVNFPLELPVVPGTNFVPRMSNGAEIQFVLPVVNAPLRIYYAYNPLRLYKDVAPQLPVSTSEFRSFFPSNGAGNYTYAEAVRLYGGQNTYQFREPRKTFRLTVSTTF
ncbi:outer membrane protein assembly factor BamA [Granulicella cerasi]|uniref:Outer membrane protein assembly factor BamA n=1 Tax=Granulicella cerasi TaxID=741063 RepID=A0ABW1ZAN3_9BACT|nr:outer membrane protein assembly factor BamA [Granulicella cerasi]